MSRNEIQRLTGHVRLGSIRCTLFTALARHEALGGNSEGGGCEKTLQCDSFSYTRTIITGIFTLIMENDITYVPLYLYR
jgi:hypothetical protein